MFRGWCSPNCPSHAPVPLWQGVGRGVAALIVLEESLTGSICRENKLSIFPAIVGNHNLRCKSKDKVSATSWHEAAQAYPPASCQFWCPQEHGGAGGAGQGKLGTGRRAGLPPEWSCPLPNSMYDQKFALSRCKLK